MMNCCLDALSPKRHSYYIVSPGTNSNYSNNYNFSLYWLGNQALQFRYINISPWKLWLTLPGMTVHYFFLGSVKVEKEKKKA